MQLDRDIFFNTDMPNAYDAVYQPVGGVSVSTVVYLDRDVRVYPDAYETGVVTTQHQITLRTDHAPNVSDGDVVVIGSETFTLSNPIDGDDFSVLAPAK